MVILEKRLYLKPCKLVNRRNNCFFNSVMQCILSIHPLTTFYFENSFKNSQKFSLSLQNFIKNYKNSDLVDPEDFISSLRSKVKILDANQQDAHEFLTLFFSQLYIELSGGISDLIDSIQKFVEYKNINFIAKTFFGLQKSTLICYSCNKESQKIEHFSCLSLEVTDNIENSLNKYFKEEILVNEDAWYCNFCKDRKKSVKKTEIIECPEILTIQLLRFTNSNTKNSKKININSVIKIKNISYKILAFACHSGSLRNGHYISYGSRDGIWYHFDDNYYKKLDSVDLNNTDSYVLFYTSV